MIVFTVCTFTALLAVPTLQQNLDTPASPCPDLFMYAPSDSKPGRWYGVIHLSTDITLHGLWLNVVLNNRADILGNWIGDVTTKNNLDFRIENLKMRISPGQVVAVRFFIEYSSIDKTPWLHAIRFNGKEICNLNSTHQAVVQKLSQPLDSSVIKPVGVQPSQSVAPITSTPVNSASSSSAADEGAHLAEGQIENSDIKTSEVKCGTLAVKPKLLSNGSASLEGQWPWHVLISESDNSYCGGTLITHRHVITAAHCITETDKKDLDPIDSVTVYLGSHDLTSFAQGAQIKYVKKIIIHPKYNGIKFNDIAIIELLEPVEYTDWVRPSCLWPEDTPMDIVGKTGEFLSWGYDVTDADGNVDFEGGSDRVCVSQLPVVSKATCIQSNFKLFSKYVTVNNFCAGNRDGKDCSRYRGGGSSMMFKMNGIWYTRGILSTCYSGDDYHCNVDHYFVFLDIFTYLPWIRENISDY